MSKTQWRLITSLTLERNVFKRIREVRGERERPKHRHMDLSVSLSVFKI